MQSYEILKEAFEKAGPKEVALKLNLSLSLVYKWCEPSSAGERDNPAGTRNPLDRIRAIYEVTKDRNIINWLCNAAGGSFIENYAKPVDPAGVVTTIQVMIKEFSDLLRTVSDSMRDDSNIDEKESRRIRKEWEELKCITESFVTACEKGIFGKNRG
ncbi:MAG: hypothetical protein JW728_01370 [Candidatus Aureabacteria bacterium]|nr:hypothetical protein [Candidatus Auribacterota bacterium]